MSIPDAVIEEVRQRADLVELVGEHTRLKRAGRTYRGPCPLHGGTGPNFSVDPGKNLFKCFTCGESGDVFSFPMKMLGMGFLDAVRFVAERAGIEIPEDDRDHPREDPHAPLHEANAFAADWFRQQLLGDAGADARAYLEQRGIDADAAERFGLGWAPESWADFGDAARRHGIPADLLLALGLVKEPSKGGRDPYDAFRGRLIFPIEDLGGRVVAFGGRVIGAVEEHVPKYLNSPETPVYHKGDVLYGLSWSRGAIRRAEGALVVEGYMDYVSLASQGVDNVVAPLGTAMTTQQAQLLARYAKRVTLLYDSDTAGLKATFRSGDELLRAGMEVLVATLPDGEDPDSLVRSKGAKVLQGYLRDAVDVLERKIQILERRDVFRSIAGVRRAVDALLPTVRAASDEVLRGVYISRISERTGVPRATIEREVAQAQEREALRDDAIERQRRARDGRPREVTVRMPPASTRPERIVLLLLLRDEAMLERAARDLSPEDFSEPRYQTIYSALLHLSQPRDAAGRWLEEFPPEVISLVEELRGDPEAASLVPTDEFYSTSVRSILLRSFEQRLAEIERHFRLATPEEAMRLLEEQIELQRKMRERQLTGGRKTGILRPRTLRDGAV
jgi:DNA primase